jgi:hypothetical protein
MALPHTAAAGPTSDSGIFGLIVVLYLLKVNIVASAGLLILQYATMRIGLALPRSPAGIAPPAA